MEMTRQTSIDAYHKIKQNGLLSKLRFDVYEYVYNSGPSTAKAIFKGLSKQVVAAGKEQPNSGVYTTRCSELRDLGVFMELPKIKCPDSGHMVIEWDVIKAALPVAPTKKISRQEQTDNLKELRASIERTSDKHGSNKVPCDTVCESILRRMDKLGL
jgi:hypothetical protein